METFCSRCKLILCHRRHFGGNRLSHLKNVVCWLGRDEIHALIYILTIVNIRILVFHIIYYVVIANLFCATYYIFQWLEYNSQIEYYWHRVLSNYTQINSQFIFAFQYKTQCSFSLSHQLISIAMVCFYAIYT